LPLCLEPCFDVSIQIGLRHGWLVRKHERET